MLLNLASIRAECDLRYGTLVRKGSRIAVSSMTAVRPGHPNKLICGFFRQMPRGPQIEAAGMRDPNGLGPSVEVHGIPGPPLMVSVERSQLGHHRCFPQLLWIEIPSRLSGELTRDSRPQGLLRHRIAKRRRPHPQDRATLTTRRYRRARAVPRSDACR